MTTNNLHSKKPIWLYTLICAYAVILAALSILNWSGADRFWWGALNLYLPQIMWVVPGILLLLATLKLDRSWVWLPLLCIVWILGPVMGFNWPLRTPAKTPESINVRLMTWNIECGSRDRPAPLAIIYEIDWNKPDIVLLQDAGGALSGPIGDYFREWHVQSFGQYVIASRHPLSKAEVRWISFQGEKHTCLRCQVHVGGKAITLYNVHFQTPRWGLNAFRTAGRKPWHFPAAIDQFENNVAARITQVQALRKYISAEQVPVIVAGDLNSPDASLVSATLRDAGLHDAFSEAGRGYGYTFGHFLLQHRLPQLSSSWMRIDHIMVDSHVRAERCWTGTGKASDHRPVIADLVVSSQ